MPREKLPLLLLVGYVILFLGLGIRPYDRATWWAENIPILLIVAGLALSYRWFRFSNGAYLMMAVLVVLHTIGGHYTFERVPFGWVTELFDFQRNHYDRIAHFTVGFYAYPAAELLLRRRLTRSRWVLLLFPILLIFTVAAVYEIIEWIYAAASNPAAGAAFLGSQGDPWDAQRDMLADGLGALAATGLFAFAWRREIRAAGFGRPDPDLGEFREEPGIRRGGERAPRSNVSR